MDANRPSTDIHSLLADLSGPEMDYVWARSQAATDKAAYESARVAKSTFYTWPEGLRGKLNEIADTLRRNRIAQAQYELDQAVADAARELVALSKDRNRQIRLRAVEGVLDRVMGKATQRNEFKGSLVNIDMSALTDEQLDRIIAGEDPLAIIHASGGGKGKETAGEG